MEEIYSGEDSGYSISEDFSRLDEIFEEVEEIDEEPGETSLKEVEDLLDGIMQIDSSVARELAGYLAGSEGVEYVNGYQLPREDTKPIPQSPSD